MKLKNLPGTYSGDLEEWLCLSLLVSPVRPALLSAAHDITLFHVKSPCQAWLLRARVGLGRMLLCWPYRRVCVGWQDIACSMQRFSYLPGARLAPSQMSLHALVAMTGDPDLVGARPVCGALGGWGCGGRPAAAAGTGRSAASHAPGPHGASHPAPLSGAA